MHAAGPEYMKTFIVPDGRMCADALPRSPHSSPLSEGIEHGEIEVTSVVDDGEV